MSVKQKLSLSASSDFFDLLYQIPGDFVSADNLTAVFGDAEDFSSPGLCFWILFYFSGFTEILGYKGHFLSTSSAY